MQKQSFSQKMTYWLKVVSLGIVLGLGLQFAQAWTAPTQAPPLGNVGGPVTLGAGAQYKTGKLGVNSATTPINALEVGGGGNVLVGGKAYSSATVDADLASTLATKGYVDGKAGGIIYSDQMTTAFAGLRSSETLVLCRWLAVKYTPGYYEVVSDGSGLSLHRKQINNTGCAVGKDVKLCDISSGGCNNFTLLQTGLQILSASTTPTADSGYTTEVSSIVVPWKR